MKISRFRWGWVRNLCKLGYEYFGNPIYTYSLKQGIADGFLAPYIVHRIVTSVDMPDGWRPQDGQTDKNGELIPDTQYTTPDFENVLSLLPRTKAVAKHLTDFMHKNDRFAKCIVFCVNQEHAEQFRKAFEDFNNDLTSKYWNYVVRIVSDEGDTGRGQLSKFMDVDEAVPVVVTTSRLLSTGVDVPTCKIIAIFRMVGSMTEFKQIVGRGTRVREDKGKLFFTILDYTGSATRNFADPDFDGEPPLITTEEINEDGETIEGTYKEESLNYDLCDFDDFDENQANQNNQTNHSSDRRKFYVEEGTVSIVNESVQILDQYGKLKTIQFTEYVKEYIIKFYHSPETLKENWLNLQQRELLLETLTEKGISIDLLKEITQQQDADIFDLLCFVAFNLKPKTRKERADFLKKNKTEYFNQYTEKAREILSLVLDKYVEFGVEQLSDLNTLLKLQPISNKGNLIEIAKEFGGVDNLRNAIFDIQTLLYAA